MKETPVVFGRLGNLVGVVSEPTDTPADGPPVLLLNAGIIHRVGPGRMYVHLARALARSGRRVLRFDLSGIGDSDPSPDPGGLQDIVPRDVADGIDLMTRNRPPTGVVLMGLCSGADTAFHVAARDARVRGLVLIDPTIHKTAGFHARRALQRVTSARSWRSVLSGRSVRVRLQQRRSGPPAPPPEYYGLLVASPRQAADWSREMTSRGVQFLYVLTSHARQYCNAPGQVRRAMRGGFSDNLTVEWRPESDHTFSREVHRARLQDTVVSWLSRVSTCRYAATLP